MFKQKKRSQKALWLVLIYSVNLHQQKENSQYLSLNTYLIITTAQLNYSLKLKLLGNSFELIYQNRSLSKNIFQ